MTKLTKQEIEKEREAFTKRYGSEFIHLIFIPELNRFNHSKAQALYEKWILSAELAKGGE